MGKPNQKKSLVHAVLAVALALTSVPALAADHGDVPVIGGLGRADANISDLHVFRRGENLVLAIGTNTAIPVGATGFAWPPDVRFVFHLDNKAEVSFDDPADNATYGGTLDAPERLSSRIRFVVSVNSNGQPFLDDIDGVRGHWRNEVQFYAGLRDDPFIRGPRQGRNVNALVIEVPLKGVQHSQTHHTFVAWATSESAETGQQFDLTGRSLRSMFPESQALNPLEPAEHFALQGVVPDVVIFNADQAAAYPNGREPTDDVVDLVGDPRVLGNDAPFPATNDRPFLVAFPYYATPH